MKFFIICLICYLISWIPIIWWFITTPEMPDDYNEDIDDDDPISVRLLSYLLLSGRIVPERERVDPRDRKPIVCRPTAKINAKFSDGFKEKVQKMYDTKKDG